MNTQIKKTSLFLLPVFALGLASCTAVNNSDTASVYFETGKHALTGEAKATLDNLATSLKGEDVAGVSLTGYADRRGGKEANNKLSKNRVHSVKDYLAHKGVKTVSTATTTWVGDTQSNTVCEEKGKKASACLQPDRRVDVTISTAPALVESGSNATLNHADLQGRHRLHLNK